MFVTSSRIIERYQIKSCPTWFSSELNRKLHLKSIHGFRQGHCKSYFRVYLLLEIYLSQDSFARPTTRHSALAGYQDNSCLMTIYVISISSGKAELREFSQIQSLIMGLVLSHHQMLSMERCHAQHMVVRDNIWCHCLHCVPLEPNVIPDILDDLQAYIEYLESQSGATSQGPGRTISFWIIISLALSVSSSSLVPSFSWSC